MKNAFLMQLFCFVFVINGPSQTLSMNDSLIYQYEKTMVILRAGPCSSSHIKGYLFVRIDSIANKSDSVFFSVTLKDSLSYSNIIMACGTWEPNVREFHDNFVYVNDSFYLYSSFALLAHYDCINWSDVPIFELSKNIACQKIDTLMSNRKIIHLVDTNSYCLDTSYFYYGIGLVYSQHIGTWEWQSVTQLYELIKYNNHEFSTDSLGLHLPHVGVVNNYRKPGLNSRGLPGEDFYDLLGRKLDIKYGNIKSGIILNKKGRVFLLINHKLGYFQIY